MNPSRTADRSELRHALGSDEAVARYVSETKQRCPPMTFSHLIYREDRTDAQDARAFIDSGASGNLTELLYKSRRNGQK